MKVFDLMNDQPTHVTYFNSDFFLSRVGMMNGESRLSYMQLKKEGVIGYHQTPVPQLMVIIEGEGKVRGKKEGYTKIKAGQAVLWDKDEWHETKSTDGMSALVIESEEMTCHITELFD